ncbi:MAG: FecR domain-containing protein [Woeseia sp.]
MDNLRQLPVQDELFSVASEWLAKLDRGLTLAEEAELQVWAAKAPENQRTLLRMAKLWDRMDTLNRLSQIFPRKAKHPVDNNWRNLSIAAMLLIVVGVTAWQLNAVKNQPNEFSAIASIEVPVPNAYETAIGEHSTVNLQDGTQVTLNTNTRITVSYSAEYRLIFLERGEIHVEVTPDKNRPLSVVAGDNIVQAVGTAFNILIGEDHRMELLVTHGAVIVSNQRRSGSAKLAPEAMPLDYISVTAGQAILPGVSDTEVSAIADFDMEVKLAWREGNLIFRGEPLSDVVQQVSRYTDIEFTFADDIAMDVRVAGRFKVGDIDGLLAALQQNFQITHQRTDANTIVIGLVN